MPRGKFKRSEEHKRKISEAKKGKKPYVMTDMIRIKMSNSQTGKKLSELTKKKIGEYRKGKHLSEESKRKLSEKNRGKHHSPLTEFKRRGGSFEPYTINWTETLKRSIRERDNYICQICSQYGNFVHHIDYDKKNCNSDNLITLCHKCHSKTNYNRNYWINYFRNLMEIKEKL